MTCIRVLQRSVVVALAAALAAGCTGPAGEKGAPGPAGAGCTVKDDGEGRKTIECADGTKVTVSDGTAGQNGQPGQNGQNGQGCTVTDNGNGTKTIECADGSKVTVSDGAAGSASSCTVTPNADGTSTITCSDGSTAVVRNGEDGDNGRSCTVTQLDAKTKKITCDDGTSVTLRDGASGESGGNVEILSHHGRAFLAKEALETSGKYYSNTTITSATADEEGVVTVNFSVKDGTTPVAGLKGFSFNIAALVPPATGEVSNRWMPYIVSKSTVSGSATNDWPAKDGDAANQGSRESNGVLTDLGGGNYKYVFAKKIKGLTLPVGGAAIDYVRSRLHRVSVMMGGRSGPTASAHFDFVPDGTTTNEKRDLVATATCKTCHGPDLAGHGGDRITVENCVTCHNPTTVDPQSGNSVDMGLMIHRIHVGRDTPLSKGPDKIYFDDPATAADESADNKAYTIWGYGNSKHVYGGEFPAVGANCEKCHTGTGANVDNWKTKPSRQACGSCHDATSFVAPVPPGMTLHSGGAQASDATCATCHPATGTISNPIYPVAAVHDWTVVDQRNIPEYTATITMTAPANGKYYVAGEAPQVKVSLKKRDGTMLDHTTQFLQDTNGAEGCPPDAGKDIATSCPPNDGNFTASALFVHGPRAHRSPVLTTAARVKVVSTAAGPFDLSAAGTNLVLKVDGGEDLYTVSATGADKVLRGLITVAVPATTTLFENKAAATHQEIVNWLNADANFKARAIAYLENGKAAIRSRNLGKLFGLQLQASAVTAAVFGGDVTARTLAGYYPSNTVAKHPTDASKNDPKASWVTDGVVYQLDPVDDLVPGTYVASIEFADRGRKSATDYNTPTVAKVTFQVKQEQEELPVAANCNSCHQNDSGKGFVLDWSRHNKIFDYNAVDTCGACHDYQTNSLTGGWGGAGAIAKRVHAVHAGAELNFPLTTVGYSNGDPVAGRNWHIDFPQDLRNCQACHPDGKTSGSWANTPSRLACGGCHDSIADQNHLRAMTWDPTPLDPFSGDEGESCAACHE